MPQRLRPLFALSLVLWTGSAICNAVPEQDQAIAVAQEVERIAGSQELWPGFQPLAVPLAILHRGRTYLFRHPAPPAGFVKAGPAWVLESQHPAIVADSSAEIGGVPTATLMLDESARTARSTQALAAVALHESFHVYQRKKHPQWSANEGDRFLYPADQSPLLAKRRLESAALQRALDSAELERSSCWTRVALNLRKERFAAMDRAFSMYERRTELNEGLAIYVEQRAAGHDRVNIPAAEFGATDIRNRGYVIGSALATLLERARPGWQRSLEQQDQQFLDVLLDSAIPAKSSCAFTQDEIASAEKTAQQDVLNVTSRRAERRKQFDAPGGWRVIVEASGNTPLMPQGFDPQNVEPVEGGLLHTRFLRLANTSAELRAMDSEDANLELLTESAGRHPLFNGVRRVTIKGLAKPEIANENGQSTLQAPGFTARFKNAVVRSSDREVRILLQPQP